MKIIYIFFMTANDKKNNEIQELMQNGFIPKHVAIIMDGNGRWAKSQNRPRVFGHNAGVNSVRKLIESSINIGIEHITLYTFSTENWNRPVSEVNALMKLLLLTLKKEIKNLIKQNVRVNIIGRLVDLPDDVNSAMKKAITDTKNNTGMNLNIALSYSSRVEIIDAIQSIATKVKNNEIEPQDIDEKLFSDFLYTKSIPDPDLLIRTSGEYRISNFLLWQIAYSELYITETLWPDFDENEFYKALIAYSKRERRFGKVTEQL